MRDVILGYLLLINICTFLLYGIDKYKARKGEWRIRETMLLGMAVIGGSFGALFGMRLFHHKTKKAKFSVGVPVILCIQIILWAFGWNHLI